MQIRYDSMERQRFYLRGYSDGITYLKKTGMLQNEHLMKAVCNHSVLLFISFCTSFPHICIIYSILYADKIDIT